jgi:hypothetical protein
MNLQSLFETELSKIGSGGNAAINVEAGLHQLTCDIVERNALAVSFNQLRLTTAYYELLVRRGGQIAVTRYRKENGAGRRQIAATVTREVLLRLVGDFCAALD